MTESAAECVARTRREQGLPVVPELSSLRQFAAIIKASRVTAEPVKPSDDEAVAS